MLRQHGILKCFNAPWCYLAVRSYQKLSHVHHNDVMIKRCFCFQQNLQLFVAIPFFLRATKIATAQTTVSSQF